MATSFAAVPRLGLAGALGVVLRPRKRRLALQGIEVRGPTGPQEIARESRSMVDAPRDCWLPVFAANQVDKLRTGLTSCEPGLEAASQVDKLRTLSTSREPDS